MRCDQLSGTREGLTLHPNKNRIRSKVAQGWRVRMAAGGLIEAALELCKRPSLHQNIKGSPSQCPHLPEMRQEILRNHKMTTLR